MASEAYCDRSVPPTERGARPARSRSVRVLPPLGSRRPALPTIVAHEGGPGDPTTSSRSLYLDLYRPMTDRRALLLVDERGTGLSGVSTALRPSRTTGTGDQRRAVRRPARSVLGSVHDRRGGGGHGRGAHLLGILPSTCTATATAPSSRSRSPCATPSSSGRWCSTARIRSRVSIPWYRTTPQRLRENLALFCSTESAAPARRPRRRWSTSPETWPRASETHPVTTTAPDGYGTEVTVTADTPPASSTRS